LERGGIDRDVIDDSFFIAVWLVRVVLLFNKKFIKYGLILSLFPVVFFILSIFFN
jgi:hypothetical protein